jgi:hypothetical protein
MLFSYTFGEKLDLTRFRKQAIHYMGKMDEATYHLYLPHYKMTVESAKKSNSTAHIITITLSDIKRDSDKEITSEWKVVPLLDTRFKDNFDIQNIFTMPPGYGGIFTTSNTEEAVEIICRVLKYIHKLNHLKAFL